MLRKRTSFALAVVLTACGSHAADVTSDGDAGGAPDGSGIDGGAGTDGAPPPISVASCQPKALSARDGDGPSPVAHQIDQRFPAPDVATSIHCNGGGACPAVTRFAWRGRDLVVLSFFAESFRSSDHRFYDGTPPRGNNWIHRVTIVAPATPAALAHSDAVAVQGGSGTLNTVCGRASRAGSCAWAADPIWPSGVPIPSWYLGTTNDDLAATPFADTVYAGTFGYTTAADFGIPYVDTDPLPQSIRFTPDEVTAVGSAGNDPCAAASSCSGEITDQSTMDACLQQLKAARRDVTNDPYINLAVAYSRLLTTAQYVLNRFYGGAMDTVAWKKAASIGTSKRGGMEKQLVAIDPRFTSLVIGANNNDDTAEYLAGQGRVWKSGFAGYPYALDALMNTDPAAAAYNQQNLAATDPWTWKPGVIPDSARVIRLNGTTDWRYPLAAQLYYARVLRPQDRLVNGPNYGHGDGTVDAVAAYRGAIDSALDPSHDWPDVAAALDLTRNVVVATAAHEPTQIDLFCTTAKGVDIIKENDPNGYNEFIHQNVVPNPSSARGSAGCCGSSSCSVACTCVRETTVVDLSDPDMRYAKWSRASMTKVACASGIGACYEGAPPQSDLAFNACIVRAAFGDPEQTTFRVSTSAPLLSRALCTQSGLVVSVP